MKPQSSLPDNVAPARARTRVLLVDDHPMVRERLAALINDEPDLTVCGEADGARGAREQLKRNKPDVLVTDLSLRDAYGIELIRELTRRYPKLPILVCSMHDETVYAERALRAGARGYVTKQEATHNVLIALRKVLAGEIYLNEGMAQAILSRMAGGGLGAVSSSPLDALTDRELEIFQLIGSGKSVTETAGLLYISSKTVEAHREHIKQKLNFKTSAELLRYAVQMTLEGGA